MKINELNFELYKSLLKAVASMSGLYSESNKALIHPRFIEKLFVHTSNATDLSRRDISFDAMLPNKAGVGVKTFIAENFEIEKAEKVAEFTKIASDGVLDNLDHYERAKKIAELRNKRIISDAHEYDIDIANSYYHCLVRTAGKAIIHEEPYSLVEVNNIYPTDPKGKEVKKFAVDKNGHTYFSDGLSKYRYDKAKNVLYKKFDLKKNNNYPEIDLPIYDNIFEKLLTWSLQFELDQFNLLNYSLKEPSKPWVDYVILPLYSYSKKSRVCCDQSGINFWNSNGRNRIFGEAYIRVPSIIHKRAPNFFPARTESFKIKLPNSKIISAKLCQSDNKALMSNPNKDLCNWVYKLIDENEEISANRLINRTTYTYDDLIKIGKDSVIIRKSDSSDYDYELESMPLDSYENFIKGTLFSDID